MTRGRTPVAPRTVLVTGASGGIGAPTALRLARRGHRVLLSGRDEVALASLARRCGGAWLAADLAGDGGIEDLVAWSEEEGPVDTVVLGAGVGWAGPVAQMPPGTVDRVLDLDLRAPVELTRRLLPGLVERRGGLVFVASIAGHVGVREEAVYSAAKAGLLRFAQSLRWELADTPVDVGVVSPGAVDTGFFARRGRPYDRARPRPVDPERVAVAVTALVERGRGEAFVPAWLRLPARLNGAVPGVVEHLARRFGG